MTRNLLALVLSVMIAAVADGIEHRRLEAQGQLIGCRGQFKGVAIMLEIYRTRFGGYPRSLREAYDQVPGQPIPVCPTAGYDTYSASYTATPEAYTLYCQGCHHLWAGAGRNYPSYSSRDGPG